MTALVWSNKLGTYDELFSEIQPKTPSDNHSKLVFMYKMKFHPSYGAIINISHPTSYSNPSFITWAFHHATKSNKTKPKVKKK